MIPEGTWQDTTQLHRQEEAVSGQRGSRPGLARLWASRSHSLWEDWAHSSVSLWLSEVQRSVILSDFQASLSCDAVPVLSPPCACGYSSTPGHLPPACPLSLRSRNCAIMSSKANATSGWKTSKPSAKSGRGPRRGHTISSRVGWAPGHDGAGLTQATFGYPETLGSS